MKRKNVEETIHSIRYDFEDASVTGKRPPEGLTT